MKKKPVLFIALLFSLTAFAGCAGNTPAPVTPSDSSVVSSQTEETSDESSSVSETTEIEDSSEPESSSDASSVPVSVDDEGSESSSQESSKPSESSKQESSKTSQSSKQESSKPSESSKQESSKPSESSKQESSKPSQSSKPSETSKQESSKPAETSKQESSKPTETSKQESSETSQPSTDKNNYDIGGLALYNELFKIENTVSVNISMSKSEIDKLNADYYNYYEKDNNKKSEIYRMATVTFKVNSKSYKLDEVGIRIKGNMTVKPIYDSKGNPNLCNLKLSFDETFDDKTDYGTSAKVWNNAEAKNARKKRKFATLNEMDIKWNISYDNTNIREVYATKLFESSNVLVQKIGLSQLIFNGNNYGLVKIYEPIDKTFLEKRLPQAAIGGDLYKCMWTDTNNSGSHTGGWRGATYRTDNSYGIQENAKGIKFNFNLKTNKKTSKHEKLKNFLSIINKSNVTKAELESVLDVDYYARFMAASYFAADPDDMRNNYNNHYIYFRKDTGKAIFIVYDNDRTLGITYGLNVNCATRNPYSNYAATAGDQQNPLIKKTIGHSPLSSLSYVRDKYAVALANLSKTKMLTSDDDFNRMYEIAKSNYSGIITPYTKFANQKETFKFSLDGNANGGEKANLSFSQYRQQIMDTYKNSKP